MGRIATRTKLEDPPFHQIVAGQVEEAQKAHHDMMMKCSLALLKEGEGLEDLNWSMGKVPGEAIVFRDSGVGYRVFIEWPEGVFKEPFTIKVVGDPVYIELEKENNAL